MNGYLGLMGALILSFATSTLAAEKTVETKPKHDANQVWLEGVPTLGWGRNKECTFAGALEAALAVTPRPWKYSDLMGVSGLAFRVRWYQGTQGQKWCPSSPVGEFSKEVGAVERATGWRLRVISEMGERQADPHMEQYVKDIVAAIDAGRPVMAYEPKLNLDVIYGYEDAGKTLLLRDYFQGEKPLSLPAEKLGPLLIFLGEYGQPLPARAALQQALTTPNWRRAALPLDWHPQKKGMYRYGQRALATWAEDLVKVDQLDEKDRGLLFFVSWWNFNCLMDARMAAVAYLNEHAAELTGDARAALERAAGSYGQELGLLGSVFGKKDAFFGPWSGKTIKDWTPEVRQREQRILTEAAKLEAQALVEIEKAVK